MPRGLSCAGTTKGTRVNENLATLADRYWDRLMEASPMWASLLGDHRFDADVADLSVEAENELIEELESIRQAATAIDPATLDKDERITRHVLMFEAQSHADSLRSRMTEFLVRVRALPSGRSKV